MSSGSLRGKGVAIDGKVLRGSFDRTANQNPLHTMTAFATETRLVIRQLSVDDKSNEIPAVPKLLALMEIEGAVITLDAMHCQKETAMAITNKKADDILTVKVCHLMFFISSLPPKVKRLSKFIRDHWKIENSEHYVLDVTFAEDASRIRRGTAPEISAAIRRMALNILQRDTTVKDNIRGKRMRAGWDDAVLDRIYAAFSGN